MSTDAPEGLASLLAGLEADHDARVLAARDTGSRAWNLAGPASDYDATALFVQRPAAYARLGGPVETVERAADEVELTAWNVRRFGELLVDSNPSALEFCHSPRIYRAYGPLSALVDDVGEQFDPMAVYHHYRSLATRQYRKYLQRRLLDDGEPVGVVVEERDDDYLVGPADGVGDGTEGPRGDTDGTDADAAALRRVPKGRYREATTDRTVKRALYVVRGVLYAEYVRDTHRFPPLDFGSFLDIAAGEASERARSDGPADETGAGPNPFTPDPALVATARDLARRKRAGEGDAVVGDPVGAAALPPERIDASVHAVRGIPRDRVNAFVTRSLADAPDRR
jgi:predicted nucleotidyltransferase